MKSVVPITITPNQQGYLHTPLWYFVQMKLIEVIAESGHADALIRLAKQHGAVDCWTGPVNSDGRQALRLLVGPDCRQEVLDAIQARLSTSETARIIIYPIEATLPYPEKKEEQTGKKKTSASVTREELYNSVAKGAQLDSNFLLLVILSTIVAAIGLLENSAAVVIGAMVIAPLLGPNIALALGTSLGDTELILESFKTNIAGLFIAFVISFLLGWLLPVQELSNEIMTRTDVGLDGVVLALASGAAAVLSLTTGLSTVLVGVMVAVALLPPTATVGLMLGSGHLQLAGGAALLLLINVVCVNLSAKLVFLYKGVKPRTWLEKEKAKQSRFAYGLFWVLSLLLLVLVITLRGTPFLF
jgi:uncharacterized hydrophobic protein (TIGR00341 family)